MSKTAKIAKSLLKHTTVQASHILIGIGLLYKTVPLKHMVEVWIQPPATYNCEIRLRPEESVTQGAPKIDRRPYQVSVIERKNVIDLHLEMRPDTTSPWQAFQLSFDVDRREILSNPHDPGLLQHEEGWGIYEFPVAAISFPLAVLLPVNLGFRLYARHQGMSKNFAWLFAQIKDHLDPATRALVEESFHNDWKKQREFNRDLSFEEVEQRLRQSALTIVTDPNRPHGTHYVWHDDQGEIIASGAVNNVWMTSTEFTQREAQALQQCYKSVTHKTLNEYHDDIEATNQKKWQDLQDLQSQTSI